MRDVRGDSCPPFYWLNRLLYFIPVLGGERALSKDIWEAVPRLYRKGFQIEIALNYYTKKSGRKMGFAVMPGLSQVIKEEKRGFCLGMWQRLKMCGEVFWISFRLYIVRFVLDLVSATRQSSTEIDAQNVSLGALNHSAPTAPASHDTALRRALDTTAWNRVGKK
jgi:hypothetical protein